MRQADFTLVDGSERTDFYWEDGVIHRRHTSVNEAAVLEENARVRNDGGARTLSFGRMVAQIPYAVYLNLKKINPALASGDNVERTKAWQRLFADGGYRDLTVGKG